MTVTHGNALQVAQNQANFRKKYTVTCVVTPSCYGNALHYGLSIFVEFKKLPYPPVIPISARFHKRPQLVLWNLLNT